MVPFEKVGIKDINLVGGKTSSLGEMISKLSKKGVKVPSGFAVTTNGFKHFLKHADLTSQINKILLSVDTHDIRNLRQRGRKVRDLIKNADFPVDLKNAIIENYRKMCKQYYDYVDVAVRSSATAEDLPTASFAGQQETFLNIRGEKALLDACKQCFASLFTDRAISYRADHGISQSEVLLSIAIQKMVRSDAACSGVAFSIDTESGFKEVVFITASYGLGENIVFGTVNPDEYYVFKPLLKKGKKPIISKKLGIKNIKMVYAEEGDYHVRNINVPPEDRDKFVLTEEEILKLAEWVCLIEEHYSKEYGKFTPMDIEWAKDGDGKRIGTGKLFVVQARPETVCSRKDKNVLKKYSLKQSGNLIVTGQAVGEAIGQGIANNIVSVDEIESFKKGEVLVTDTTDPDWEPIMKIASAIVTNRGGRTCHAAIVSRELGIPCIVGTEKGTNLIKTGDKITISCTEGEVGKVYEGLLKYEVERIDLQKLPRTRTKIMMNVGIPEQAFTQGQIPCDGVGLAREEFIVNSYIGIHPLALLDYANLKLRAKKDTLIKGIVEEIDRRTRTYENKVSYFIDNLAQGIARIAASFYPNDVIVRLSDFKTNEYANLLGGQLYEPKESNPMIGWRGASRYYDLKFKTAFKLECDALKKVREEMGLTNVKVMVPFCRTPEEGKKVLALLEEYGLKQGVNGLEIYMMVEIPSNVILAEQFADLFDGFSIGSNDLTQLTLGLDRDSELVAHIYDERNAAVKTLIRHVIEIAKRKKVKIGICGQAPSDFPDFAEFLVKCGIDSISLNPDTVLKTRLIVANMESKLKRK